MLVEIPLTDTERAAVKDDHKAVDRLIDVLRDVVTLAAPTPRQLHDRLPAGHGDAQKDGER